MKLKFNNLPRFGWQWLIVIILLAMCLLLCYGLNDPFLGHHDANGVWIGGAARNLWFYGVGRYTFIPILQLAPIIPPALPEYYVNHPPLVVYASAISQTLFGERDLSLRLASVFATLVSLSGFAVFFRRLLGPKWGVVALCLYSFTPMITFFGRMPDHEPLALAFISLFLAIWMGWYKETPKWNRLVGLCLLAGFAIWSAWPSFFFVVCCGILGWWHTKGVKRRQSLVILLSAPCWAMSVILFYLLQYPRTLEELIATFRTRSTDYAAYMVAENSKYFSGAIPSFAEWITVTLLHLVATATLGLLILALVGAVMSLRDSRTGIRGVGFGLLLSGVFYIVIFRNVSYVHDYYKIFMMPGLAVLGTIPLSYLSERRRRRNILLQGVVMIYLASAISGFIAIHGWYDQLDGFEIRTLGMRIRSQLPENAVLITNMEYTAATQYYAFRTIQWGVAPEKLPTLSVPERPAYYMYCQWADPQFQDGGYIFIIDSQCNLTTLAETMQSQSQRSKP